MSETAGAAPPSRAEQLAGLAMTAAGAIPLGLAVVAEAAWVTVVASLVQVYALREPVLDIAMMVVFVVIGLAVSRLFGLRFGGRWPAVALGLSGAAALAGVLLSPDARAVFADRGLGGLAAALAAHPGGLLAGMALLRGIAWGHAGLPLPEDRLVRLLGGGLMVLTFAAIAGSLVTEPVRGRFLAEALGSGLAFGACSIVALALTRQAIAAGDVAAAWQRNPTWVVALLLLIAGSVGLALAVAGQVRSAIELIVAVAAVPIIILGLIGGWTRRTFRVVFLLFGGFVIVGALGSAFDRVRPGNPAQPTGVGAGASPVDTAVAAGVAGIVTVLAILVVLLLVRLWMRQFRIEAENPIEERYVDRTADTEVRPRRSFRRPFGPAPVDAAGAYRALLSDLADRYGVRREAWETPREHAARLRAEDGAGLSLDLLAADYALARFGGVALSAVENRRAVSRWRRLRRSLRARPEPLPDELGPDLG